MELKVLSIGIHSVTGIDVEASSNNNWCDGLYLPPIEGGRELMSVEEVNKIKIDSNRYGAILLWHQSIHLQLKLLLDEILIRNPSICIIGNSHGYNKSISELIDGGSLNVPQYYMDFYSMWGKYFTDRYKRVYKKNPYKHHLLSLGSLRHEYLYKNFKWDKNKTNGRVLVIHEPVTSESWNEYYPIGDNRITESILEELERKNIPFDFKVHPNWPDFISNSFKPMWRPPSHVNLVDVPMTEMINYDAVIASWSSVQFDALAMRMPVINIKYDYPKEYNSEWGPGKYGLLKSHDFKDISASLAENARIASSIDMNILTYFLGDLGNISENYYSFLKNKSNTLDRKRRVFYRYSCMVKRKLGRVKRKFK